LHDNHRFFEGFEITGTISYGELINSGAAQSSPSSLVCFEKAPSNNTKGAFTLGVKDLNIE
jgi:hypothetical protein